MLVLQISLAVLLIHNSQVHANTTSTPSSLNTDSSGSNPSITSLVGFCVVVSFLVISLCVVMLVCSRYGPKKCPCKVSALPHRRTGSLIPALSPRVTQPPLGGENPLRSPQHQTTPRHHHHVSQLSRPQEVQQQREVQRNSSSVSHQYKHSRQPSTSSLQPPTSMMPSDTLQMRPEVPYQGIGYPYQPCKSPRTPYSINIHHSFDFQPPAIKPPLGLPHQPPGMVRSKSYESPT